MTGDKLTFDSADEGSLWLILTSASGLQQKELLLLRNGFSCEQVCEAVMATGWVRKDGDDLLLTNDMGCQPLRDVVEAMLGYFEEPGVPSLALREIQSAVSEYDSVHALRRVVPLFAFAWLDVMVREDLADRARSTSCIWLNLKVVIDLRRYCDSRVAELVTRYSPQTATSAIGPLAPSMPTRKAAESRAKLG